MAKFVDTARLRQSIESLCLAGSTNFENDVAVEHLAFIVAEAPKLKLCDISSQEGEFFVHMQIEYKDLAQNQEGQGSGSVRLVDGNSGMHLHERICHKKEED